jgi:hypothetical protein
MHKILHNVVNAEILMKIRSICMKRKFLDFFWESEIVHFLAFDNAKKKKTNYLYIL